MKVVELARHKNIPYIRCFDWSPVDPTLVSIGQTSGEAVLLRLDIPTTAPSPLAVKHQRACNSVSFNSNGTLLATGLDKVRSDFCLNIWDVSLRLAHNPPDTPPRPTRQLAGSEAISSVRFTADNPMTVIAGVSYRFIRMFDLRESPSSPAISCPTRCVYGIALDTDPNYFASHSEEGIVAVWDRRYAKLNPACEPALRFDRVGEEYSRAGSQITALRYATGRPGTFAALNSGGGLRVYETARISDPDSMALSSTLAVLEEDVHKPRPGGWATGLLEAGRGAYGGTSTSGTRTPSNRGNETGETLLVNRITDLALPGKTGKGDKKISTFDWILEGRGKGGTSGPLRILITRNDGTMEVLSCPGSVPSIAWGSRNQFSITCERDVKMMPTPDLKLSDSPRSRAIRENDDFEEDRFHYGSPDHKIGILERRRTERSNSVVRPEDFLPAPAEVLKNDICVTMRRRVEAGYLMDCAKNAALAKDENQYLEDMWVWLDGAQECAKESSMMGGSLDLSYLGVATIWNGGTTPTSPARIIGTRKPRKEEWTFAAAEINRKARRSVFMTRTTDYPEQRRLCLAVCGWNYEGIDLENELIRLERNLEYSKAAGWALFHGDIERAITSLQQGGQQLKLMSTAVAGYYSTLSNVSTPNSIWKTLASEMATELYDPYLRAIFAYVSNSEWKDVLDEIGLPIRERIGIAVRWLADDQLTNYLNETTKAVVHAGDLDGLMLTGVTEPAVNLLQVYINRTADVQTASLVASFACPRYLSDDRVDYWIESYRHLLNSWRLFHVRAKFDVARGRASRDRTGAMTLAAPPRQVYVRCANCDRSISHSAARSNMIKKLPKQMTMREKQATGTHAEKPTVCPHCRKSLPRCAVCLLNLGTIYYNGPEDRAKDPLKDYDRWYVDRGWWCLGGCANVMCAGSIFV